MTRKEKWFVGIVMLSVVFAACDNTHEPGPGAGNHLLVPLKEGNAVLVRLQDHAVTPSAVPAMAISTDAVVRRYGDAVYVVNRFGFDNVVVLDAATLAVRKQFSTGAGTNPQDIAVANERRVYVPLYQTGEVLVADPTLPDGSEVLARIPLTSIAENPTPTSAVVVGDAVYVALAFIDPVTYAAARNGLVAVIDVATNSLKTTIELPHRNPFARMQRVPSRDILVLNLAEDFDGQAGCYATVDLRLGRASCAVPNSACGGWSGALWATEGGHVYAAASAGFMADGTLCHFTIDGTVLKAGLSVDGSLTDVAVSDTGVVIATSTKGEGGLFFFDAASDTPLATAPLTLGGVPAFASGLVFLTL